MGTDQASPPEATRRLEAPPRGRARAVAWIGFLLAIIALAASIAYYFETRTEEATLARVQAVLVHQKERLIRLERTGATRSEVAPLASQLAQTRRALLALTHTVQGISRGARTAGIMERIQESRMLLILARHILPVEPGRGTWALGILKTVRGLIQPFKAPPALATAQRLLNARIHSFERELAHEPRSPASVLAALARQASQWPLLRPRPPKQEEHPVVSKGGFWARIASGLAVIFHDLVAIHRLPVRPAPPPGARHARRIRLRLALDFSLAETAWLVSDRSAYRDELAILRTTLGRHYDLLQPDVRAAWLKLGVLAHARSSHPRLGVRPVLQALDQAREALGRSHP